jgi:hypothetical protein
MNRSITFEVSGVEFEAAIDDEGKFSVTLDDEIYEADSLNGLRGQLRDAIIARRMEVPFITTEGDRGVMRGFHAGNRDVLVTWESGSKGRLSPHIIVFRDGEITDEEIEELKTIQRQGEELRARKVAISEKAKRTSEILEDAVGENLLAWGRHR